MAARLLSALIRPEGGLPQATPWTAREDIGGVVRHIDWDEVVVAYVSHGSQDYARYVWAAPGWPS